MYVYSVSTRQRKPYFRSAIGLIPNIPCFGKKLKEGENAGYIHFSLFHVVFSSLLYHRRKEFV